MKIKKLPDVEPEEKIYGFQVFLNNWIIEITKEIIIKLFTRSYSR